MCIRDRFWTFQKKNTNANPLKTKQIQYTRSGQNENLIRLHEALPLLLDQIASLFPITFPRDVYKRQIVGRDVNASYYFIYHALLLKTESRLLFQAIFYPYRLDLEVYHLPECNLQRTRYRYTLPVIQATEYQ